MTTFIDFRKKEKEETAGKNISCGFLCEKKSKTMFYLRFFYTYINREKRQINMWFNSLERQVKRMEFTEMDEVRVRTYGGTIGTIEKVIYEIVDGKETDNVYCYEMEINGKHGIIVYPDEIDE